MEPRDLRYFTVIAEHKNLGRAAEALDLSPPALSKSLRRLEQSVGAKLVQRSTKGVELTAVGAALLTRLAPLQGILNDVRTEAADLAKGFSGHVRAGAIAGVAENLVADACVSLSRETPRVTLKIWADHGHVLSNALRKGEIDFYVGSLRAFSAAEFVREKLYDDQFVVFASASHRLAKRKQVSLSELVGERWASTNSTLYPQWQQLFHAFESNGIPVPVLALDTNSHAVRLPAIAFSNYLGISSRQFVLQEASRYPLVELPIKEMSYVRHMSIIYRKDGYLSPAVRRLIDILKAQTKKTTASNRGSSGAADLKRRPQ